MNQKKIIHHKGEELCVEVTKINRWYIDLFVNQMFQYWGHFDKKKQILWHNSNDITTSLGEEAMIKFLKQNGFKRAKLAH